MRGQLHRRSSSLIFKEQRSADLWEKRELSPEPVVHRPEPVVYRPEPVVHRPEPVVHRPEPVYHRPAPVVHRPQPVQVIERPSNTSLK